MTKQGSGLLNRKAGLGRREQSSKQICNLIGQGQESTQGMGKGEEKRHLKFVALGNICNR